MVGVIVDHYLQLSNHNVLINTGIYIGGVSVAVFLAISAYLYGAKWRKMGCQGFDVFDFLYKRFMRIFIPLWLTLLVAIPLELYAGHEVSGRVVVFNILGLGWVSPLMWQGHLWYITMTLIVYGLFLVISRFRLDKIPIWLYAIAIVLLSGLIICFPQVFDTFSRVIIPLTLLYSTMMFASGDKVLEICQRYKWWIVIATVIVILAAFYFYLLGWRNSHKGIASLMSAIAGVMTFLCLMSVVSIKKKNKVISWFSSCSYEIYLIHPSIICFVAMCMGKGWIVVPLGLLLIAVAGWRINLISEQLYQKFR